MLCSNFKLLFECVNFFYFLKDAESCSISLLLVCLVINTHFLLFILDVSKFNRLICASSVNTEVHTASVKRMSKLMKFCVLLRFNVFVALCQKYFVHYSGGVRQL